MREYSAYVVNLDEKEREEEGKNKYRIYFPDFPEKHCCYIPKKRGLEKIAGNLFEEVVNIYKISEEPLPIPEDPSSSFIKGEFIATYMHCDDSASDTVSDDSSSTSISEILAEMTIKKDDTSPPPLPPEVDDIPTASPNNIDFSTQQQRLERIPSRYYSLFSQTTFTDVDRLEGYYPLRP